MNRAVSCQMINAKLDRNVEMNVNENLPLLKDPDFTIGKFVPFQRPELGLTGDCEPGSYIFK
uniref:Transmembrane and TPR repeat-containing protein 3 n=1 Tax=Phallusia mammillata TaxID=59560 RepID=A0A6F9DUN1_9ASCI|nr:transmembrane and TPR repeat-containing protein 3 [Phallusia mammillata]